MKYVTVILLLLLASCQDVKRPEAPENLISETQMVAVLTDAYLMNAARSIDIRKIRKEGIYLDSIIYATHKIDSLQFAKSNAYYTNNLNTYNDLITKVEQKLITEKTKRDSLYEIFKEGKEELKRLDSIYKAKIDSMAVEMPAVSRDSLEILLDAENAKLKTSETGITDDSVVSQDSIL
ncbi:hypothetical protein ULMS_00830 [Patiriisocius marinistellae]|uniref:DUF4296 domain-containing protein n=1 Tax=Patiriisocius marinistellae TaxID=2494560 RepID=A0A5J4FX10_9FLAO|nr:DUF4296 domain-containing protein [Patiriisocius marinistellae]GEQ84575.1 hypothetical protein ULMS_00830 [Patiriisocius marinistellae]